MGYDEKGLEEADVSLNFGGYGDAANQLRDGIIDITVQGGGPGVPALTEVDSTRTLRLLEVPEDVMNEMDEAGYGYSTGMTIPAGTYSNQTEDVDALASWAMMIMNEAVNDHLVYEMTKQIWESVDRVQEEQPSRGAWFDPEHTFDVIENPEENIHPGALRYYEEIGAYDGGGGE
ncbi:TRAP transporter solute receptor, TAXI family precursor [Geomicrobium sp. JCM 19037]|uniref:TAXI family TRAP transporter solute-binding subunit n=1 Tax=Geomicrobium sp. JCM 19037 TaxID=1460634 RepID=UPI00045F2E13|nr:TAXI family TRAP transporter solute-binding subunit [Geomicrobium sp. JCM 19037]GAK05489.1 TRAP transporter solute receptor, TAXI family precursor [Geomicrobium sp. JCM 19037]